MIAQAIQETAPAIERDEPDFVYHDRSEIGASMLEDFRENRQVYRAAYVDKTRAKREATPAMQFGTLVHLRVLEPAKFAEVVADPPPEIAPDGKKWLRRKGSDHEKWWQDELDRREGKIVADQAMLNRVNAAAAAIKRHAFTAGMLESGESEVSHYWTDDWSGLRCKCRIDWLAAGGAIDIKTCPNASPAGFARSAVQLGNYRKQAHYRAGLAAVHGEGFPIVYVAVESEWPHRVGVYELDDLDRDGSSLGRQQWRESLGSLANCLAKDEWSEPWETGVTALRIPGYAWNENDYTFGGSDDSSDR